MMIFNDGDEGYYVKPEVKPIKCFDVFEFFINYFDPTHPNVIKRLQEQTLLRCDN